jgi:hypothetical protein
MYARRRVVVRYVVAMSDCRSVQIEGLAYKPSDRVTSRQRAARQRIVWRASLEAGRQEDSATRFASDKKRFRLCCRYRQRNAQSVPNQPPYQTVIIMCSRNS